MRIGIGYDVHRLVENRDLILGGVKFDYDKGLLGHSDADVLTHAIMDAILGALAEADIGKIFPDTDPKYKGIYSIELLDNVVKLMDDRGYKIGNIDSVIICEMPKISPKRDEIRNLLKEHLNTDIENISIKASTSEGLGFTGKSLGIEARAVVILEEKWWKKFVTSESVTEGHPDKVCDRISDAILDECLRQDKNSRVACETVTSTGLVLVVGEISTTAYAPVEQITRNVIKEIGYDDPSLGFDYSNVAVLTSLIEQSADIAQGVNSAQEYKSTNEKYDQIGAGDQGIIFGYADNETEEYLPVSVSYAHKLAMRLTEVRKDGILSYLRPDGKTQVTVEYDDDKLVRIDNIVISAQHTEDVSLEKNSSRYNRWSNK